MWAYILLNLAASIACVALIHYLWQYFRDKYTVKKTRDIVGAQTRVYKEMMADLLVEKRQNEINDLEIREIPPQMETNSGEYISPEQKEEMVRELRLLLIQ